MVGAAPANGSAECVDERETRLSAMFGWPRMAKATNAMLGPVVSEARETWTTCELLVAISVRPEPLSDVDALVNKASEPD